MALLEKLYTVGEENERECALTFIELVLDHLQNGPVVINNSVSLCPYDSIFINGNHIFIPESLLESFESVTYLDIPDLVEILSNTRYNGNRIIPENFYSQYEVSTDYGIERIDCMKLNHFVIRRLAIDLYKDLKRLVAR